MRKIIMPQYSLQDVEAQLSADTSGDYKRYLLDVLRQYQKEFEVSKSKMLPAREYEQIESLDRAIDAAIGIIESKRPENGQDDAFNNIF
jgi:hypothetical protein